MRSNSEHVRPERSENRPPERAQFSGQTSCSLSGSSSARLLQRLSPVDYREARAVQFAAPLPDLATGDRITVLIFCLGHEWFALPAKLCRQVLSPLPAHTLPHRSNAILIGVVNISGQMLLKVSLLELLGQGRCVPSDDSNPRGYARMVVMERANADDDVEVWVFEVDKLEGICSLEKDCLESSAVGTQVSGAFSRQVFRWKDTDVSLLDDEQLFEALRQRTL